MATATTCTALSVASTAGGACLFSHLPRTLAKTNMSATSIVSSKWIYSSKTGLNPLQRECAIKKIVPTRKLQVRAARTESQGVSLGFRAPSFELPEPLTGKTWKLEDFEPYPALLVMFICNHCHSLNT
uniref:Uncharacterized protein n=1 Tax=Salix viminalis TaxID=40686 RepID=A0A6N2MJ85_SALVM